MLGVEQPLPACLEPTPSPLPLAFPRSCLPSYVGSRPFPSKPTSCTSLACSMPWPMASAALCHCLRLDSCPLNSRLCRGLVFCTGRSLLPFRLMLISPAGSRLSVDLSFGGLAPAGSSVEIFFGLQPIPSLLSRSLAQSSPTPAGPAVHQRLQGPASGFWHSTEKVRGELLVPAPVNLVPRFPTNPPAFARDS